jgi:hypothetical protein
MDILALSNLLQRNESVVNKHGQDNDSYHESNNELITPASFGPPLLTSPPPPPPASSSSSSSSSTTSQISAKEHQGLHDQTSRSSLLLANRKDIWSLYENTHGEDNLFPNNVENEDDHREEPLHQIYFKQEVGTEDMFLGMEKSPGSYDCTHLVVKINFPNSKIDELNVDVKSNRLLAESRDKYVEVVTFLLKSLSLT